MGGEEENCEKKDALLEEKHEAKNAWVLQMQVQRRFTQWLERESQKILQLIHGNRFSLSS